MIRVLILGAGPAGSSCAIQLRKAGHEVILLDRTAFPRNMPGETLHPGVEPLLEQLGLAAKVEQKEFLRHKGISQVKAGQTEFHAYHASKDWQGFQLYRYDFDNLLLHEAIRLGVDWRPSCSPVSITRKDNNVISVNLLGSSTIEADYFVDATGKRAWLAKACEIEIETHSPKRIAYYGYVGAKELVYEHPQLMWDADGWTWVSQVKPNAIAWVRLNLTGSQKQDKDYIPNCLQKFESLGSRKAVEVTWRKANHYSSHNLFLVGDAAFVLDPGASHGVLKALMSGMMAAHLIHKSLGHPLAQIHDYYHQWMEQQFVGDMEALTELYRPYQKIVA